MLIAILEEDGITPSQLAEKVALDRTTTTGLLDRLEKADWIKRHHDEADRRTLLIYITEKAKKHKNEILQLFKETNKGFLARFQRKSGGNFRTFSPGLIDIKTNKEERTISIVILKRNTTKQKKILKQGNLWS